MSAEKVPSVELKQKISEVSYYCHLTSMRLMDYIWNVWYLLNNQELVTKWWRIDSVQLENIRNEFSKIAEKIISMKHNELVSLLKANPPQWKWTQSNIESIKKTLLN